MRTIFKVFFGLSLTAALLIGILPTLLILGEAASDHFKQRFERAVIDTQMKDIADAKGMKMLPDGFNPQLAKAAWR